MAPEEMPTGRPSSWAQRRAAAKAIPEATLVEFAELGHSPQVQDPKQFNSALLKALKSR